jgi:hypothetical protein
LSKEDNVDRQSLYRRWAPLLLVSMALVLPACDSDGHFSILGYTTVPNYDPNIRTVYVPIFENRTFRRGIEQELTMAVVRAIEQNTPFKVVSDCDKADTELRGTITAFTKGILNRNQLNEVREAETIMTVEVVWRDRRTGEILSGPARRAGDLLPPPAMIDIAPGTVPTIPLGVAGPGHQDPQPTEGAMVGPLSPPPPAALVSSYSTYIPEVGGSITTSLKRNLDRLALQIVHMMEVPW